MAVIAAKCRRLGLVAVLRAVRRQWGGCWDGGGGAAGTAAVGGAAGTARQRQAAQVTAGGGARGQKQGNNNHHIYRRLIGSLGPVYTQLQAAHH